MARGTMSRLAIAILSCLPYYAPTTGCHPDATPHMSPRLTNLLDSTPSRLPNEENTVTWIFRTTTR